MERNLLEDKGKNKKFKKWLLIYYNNFTYL